MASDAASRLSGFESAFDFRSHSLDSELFGWNNLLILKIFSMEVVTARVVLWQYKERGYWYSMLDDIALQYERAYRCMLYAEGPTVAYIRLDDHARYEADLEEMFQRRQQWQSNDEHLQRNCRSTPYNDCGMMDTQFNFEWVVVKCREIRRQILECPLLD